VAELGLGLEELRLPDDDKAAASPSSEQQLQLKALLEPLDKEKLKNILLTLAAQNDAIAEQCASMAAEDLANRKLFVRGLAWGTTDEGLRAAFGEYGEITEGGVAVDRMTGKSRGFGFVTFATAAAAQAALREPNKQIDGRQTTCNLASAGAQQRPPPGGRGQGAGPVGTPWGVGTLGGMAAMGGMGALAGMGPMSPYGASHSASGFVRGGGMPLSPRMPASSMPNVNVGGMPTSYERYLTSMYSNYAPPMMPPPSGYENLGR